MSINKLSGRIPSSFSNLVNLNYLNFKNNQLTDTIPSSLINLTRLSNLTLDSNKLTFESLENIATAFSFATYSPQANININLNGNKLSVSAGGTLMNNTYTWYKNGHLYKTKTGDSTLRISKSASYYVNVTNSVATQLTLYSDTINYIMAENSIAKQINTSSLISVYPNPAKTTITLSFTANGKYSITVSDISGKILQNKTGIALKGLNTIQFDVSKYAGGVYFIIISDEKNNKQTIRLNKQ